MKNLLINLPGITKPRTMALFILLIISVVSPTLVYPADAGGIWKSKIETPVGLYDYIFDFKQEGDKLTGKIFRETNGEKSEADVQDGKMKGDSISFVETLQLQDFVLTINYSGKIVENEMKLTRQVGEFATEQVTAKRDIPIAETPRRPMQQPIVLGPDDKPAYAAAPVGFDVKRENISRGKTETVEYDSKTVGNMRKLLIYTPPGFSSDKKYPVLYLLHGIGGDELEWFNNGHPEIILDNLYADKKLVPMIVVLPNGRAMKDDRSVGNLFDTEKVKAFETFEQDLLNDIIPFVASKYPVKATRESRALAGLSMGGGQSLNFGLGNLNTFAWIGGFSSAPNTKASEVLVPNPVEATKKLKLLWISCGDQDGLISISQNLHKYAKTNNVPHIWHVDSGKHDFLVWKNDLYLFSQLLFK